jgi:adenine-specific DNA-methyltransferase
MKKMDRDHDGSSLNIEQDNIEQLKTLFPDIFSEGKIDFDKLRETLGDTVETREERYNFTWHGKSQARRIAQTPSTGTLRPCKAESKHWDSTQNLFIEGDNLEVLKLMQKSYHKQVKMIYIDPPYNTGKEFIYPDNYQDNLDTYLEYTGQKDSEGRKFGTNTETTGRYHTNWLNMMYPRLKLARNLLRDDGVIFISIDDNEVANLRKLCDEIFGEENFVSNVIWQSRTSISNDQEISLNHNHTLIYSKNREQLVFHGEPLNKSEYSNPDQDPRGPWKLVPIDANKPGGDTLYPIINPKTKNEYYPPNNRSWAMNSKDYQKLFDDGRIKFGMNDDSAPKKKLYLKERIEKGDSKTPSSILLNAGTTKSGTTELMDIFDGKKIFDYPKPTSFIQRLLNYGCHKNEPNLVIDFFAGSCPLAHACFNLTANDDQEISFISIQLPEQLDKEKPHGKEALKLGYKTIADIGKERIRRAGEKILQDNADKGDIENLDIGFKVFKLDSSNIEPWDGDFDNLENALLSAVNNIKKDRSEDDVLYEILLKYGLDLTVPIEERQINGKTVYSIGLGALVVCLDDAITLDVVEGIGSLKKELAPEVMRVVFKDSGFKDDVVKTNAIQILKKYGIDDVKSL